MWGSFTIVTKDFFGNNCKLDDLDAICATISGLGLSNTTPGSSFYDDGGGNYSSDFGLSEPGIYQLKVTIFDCPIKNYPLEFEVKKYENSIYSTNQLSNKGAYLRSLGVKLTVNQKEIKIGPHEWTLGTESVLPLRPTYCQILDVKLIFFAASLDCSDIAWMCDFSSVWKVSLDRGKERVTNVFSISSFWESLRCIEMVPGYELSSQPTKIDSIDAELQTTTCYIKEDIGIKEARSEATFRHKFENLSQVNDSVFSPTFFVRNLPWRILVQQLETESVKTLGVNLYCDGCPESSYWSCKAEAEFRLIRQNGDEPLTRKFGQANVFAKNHQTWGFSEFANWNDVLDPSKGFIKDDLIILEVSVSADTPQGVSDSSMQYNGYVPLAKQAARSDLLLPRTPFLFSNGANVINSSGSMPRQDLSVQSPRTIWLGSNKGTVYILSAEDQSVYSSIKIKLPDSVVQIIHFKDKVFIALLNGECCVFIRSQENLCWNFSEYFLVDINETSLAAENTPSCTDEQNSSKTFPSTEIPEESMSSKSGSSLDEQDFAKSISCMASVGASIWLASQNSIYILDCETLRIISRFDINDTVGINKMVATEEYVWFSCSNRIIQLFSAIEPYEKVMSIDIRPDLKRMLIPALTDSELDSIARITALKASITIFG